MIAISDSCFNLIYLLKQTTGIWGRCTVRSHQPVFHIATSQLETGRCLAFCASTLLISCRSIRRFEAVWRTLEHFCVTAAHCHETSFLKWTSFSQLHRWHSETSILRVHWRGLLSIGSLRATALHVQVFVSLPNACLNWQAPVYCVTPPNCRKNTWKNNRGMRWNCCSTDGCNWFQSDYKSQAVRNL